MDVTVSDAVAADIPTEEFVHSEDHLAARGMFLKEYDLLDLDHGHFWYKLLWKGTHVEFPSRVHHYEPDVLEKKIRDYLIGLPLDVLENAYTMLTTGGQSMYAIRHADHTFELVWDNEVQRHLHCFYERSEQGKEKDRRRYEQHVQAHAERYEKDRQFPSWRLHEELRHLKEERAKAQKVVDSWECLIVQCQERIAEDELIHLGHVDYDHIG